jgi:hypothetical protein
VKQDAQRWRADEWMGGKCASWLSHGGIGTRVEGVEVVSTLRSFRHGAARVGAWLGTSLIDRA